MLKFNLKFLIITVFLSKCILAEVISDAPQKKLTLSFKNQNIVISDGELIITEDGNKSSFILYFKDKNHGTLVSIRAQNVAIKYGDLQSRYVFNTINHNLLFSYKSSTETFYISPPITLLEDTKTEYTKLLADPKTGLVRPVKEKNTWKSLTPEQRMERQIAVQNITDMVGSFFSMRIKIISENEAQVNFMGMTKKLGDGFMKSGDDFFHIKSNKVIIPIKWIRK